MNKKILLVEDEVIIALEKKVILEKEGYDVVHANTGKKAVEIAQNTKNGIDLVLMDINLGSGIDGTQAAKNILGCCDVPIIFLSSHQEKEIVEKTEKITSYGYVVKNSTDFVLFASIKMAFKLHEANREKNRTTLLMDKTNENVPGVVYQFKTNEDGTSCFPFSTHRIWDIYEVTPEEVKKDASKVFERLHPDDLEIVKESIYKSYRELSTWECDYRVILPEKGERWLRGMANPEKKDDCVLWHGYITDITERKTNEQKLKSLNTAVKQSPSGIVITDKNGKIEFVNDKILEVSGYTREELMGKNPNIFSSGKQDKKFYEDLWGTILSGDTWQGKMVDKKKNGEFYWEKAIISPVMNEKGEIIKLIGLKEDVTEMKKYEDDKDTILREAQHRMKNSLSSIEALVSMQLMNTEHEEAKKVLIDVKGRVQSMRLVYDKILETQNYDNISVRNYFNDFIEAIISVFQNGSSIKIEKDIDDFYLNSKSMFALGVITNECITNSMKYAFKGKKEGTINLDIKKNKDKVFFEVSDNGKGIDEEIIKEPNSSFGMILIHSMCEQLGSDYSMYNDNGFKLKAEFKV